MACTVTPCQLHGFDWPSLCKKAARTSVVQRRADTDHMIVPVRMNDHLLPGMVVGAAGDTSLHNGLDSSDSASIHMYAISATGSGFRFG